MLDIYPLVRPILFALPPETAHGVSLTVLRLAHRAHLLPAPPETTSSSPLRLMGLTFPNRLGVAAGLDKNATCVDALGTLGFGFIEVGTVTPLPQPGNSRPRLFRLTRARALVNRMGFPNEGAATICERLRGRRFIGPVGVNIGKNASRPIEEAVDDYVSCLGLVYPVADYIAVNISSPNTADLRSLQHGERLRELTAALVQARTVEQRRHNRYVPLLIKLTADLSEDVLSQSVRIAMQAGIDGVIASNTTIRREGIDGQIAEEGGLSGPPLYARAVRAVQCIRSVAGAHTPIIGVGGIESVATARAMLSAGADLLQVYTGFVYRGPRLIREIVAHLIA